MSIYFFDDAIIDPLKWPWSYDMGDNPAAKYKEGRDQHFYLVEVFYPWLDSLEHNIHGETLQVVNASHVSFHTVEAELATTMEYALDIISSMYGEIKSITTASA